LTVVFMPQNSITFALVLVMTQGQAGASTGAERPHTVYEQDAVKGGKSDRKSSKGRQDVGQEGVRRTSFFQFDVRRVVFCGD
jgi:hypothetical protein